MSKIFDLAIGPDEKWLWVKSHDVSRPVPTLRAKTGAPTVLVEIKSRPQAGWPTSGH